MAFNGSGVYVRLYNWTNDANAAINIKADRMDNEDTGFAGGLSNCICKDGQTTITANLPMATFRHTGVGNAVNRSDYAAAGQAQDGKFVYLGTTGGAADVQTATATPTLPAYAAGQVFRFIAGFTNATTTPTLNIDGLGAKTIQKLGGVLAASDIAAGKSYEVMYDGTNFQILSLVPAVAPTDATLSTSDITTNNVSTAKHGFAPKAPNDATKYLDGTGAYSAPLAGTRVMINQKYFSSGTSTYTPTSGAVKADFMIVGPGGGGGGGGISTNAGTNGTTPSATTVTGYTLTLTANGGGGGGGGTTGSNIAGTPGAQGTSSSGTKNLTGAGSGGGGGGHGGASGAGSGAMGGSGARCIKTDVDVSGGGTASIVVTSGGGGGAAGGGAGSAGIDGGDGYVIVTEWSA